MATYIVARKVNTSPGLQSVRTERDGVDGWVIRADSSALAKDIANSMVDGDSPFGSTLDCNQLDSGYGNYRFRVKVSGPPNQPDIVNVSFKQAGMTVDSAMTALVALLNATPYIKNAAHVGGTRVLTIAGGADNLGDRSCVLEVTYEGTTFGASLRPIPTFIDSYVQRGAVGDPLQVTFGNWTDYASVRAKVKLVIASP